MRISRSKLEKAQQLYSNAVLSILIRQSKEGCFFLKVIQHPRNMLRTKRDVLGLFVFPLIVALAYALYAFSYHCLSPAAQNSIENGSFGAQPGILFGVNLVGAACVTLRYAADILLRKSPT